MVPGPARCRRAAQSDGRVHEWKLQVPGYISLTVRYSGALGVTTRTLHNLSSPLEALHYPPPFYLESRNQQEGFIISSYMPYIIYILSTRMEQLLAYYLNVSDGFC